MEGPDRPDGAPDNWWWLVVKTPGDGVHLYELGYAVVDEEQEGALTVLTQARFDEIRDELGAPLTNIWEHPGWSFDVAPGRPNAWLEPKLVNPDGTLEPITAKPGVTLHLKQG